LKNLLGEELSKKLAKIEEEYFDGLEEKEAIDVTLEFPIKNRGHKHPISITTELLEEIFISL
jgi:phenylalanyl-tRNA synthetase alpha subunit